MSGSAPPPDDSSERPVGPNTRAEPSSNEDPPTAGLADGIPISGVAASRSPEEGTVQLTDLSVRAISLYQKRAELTDWLWSYFGTNSAFAVLAALAAPLLERAGVLPRDWAYLNWLLGLAVLAYFAFSLGNRHALRVSQEALERIAAQAEVASGIRLEVVRPVNAVFFHKTVSGLVTVIMVFGFFPWRGM